VVLGSVESGLVLLVCVGIGSWLSMLGPQLSRVGRQRLFLWGLAGIVAGVGQIVGEPVLEYFGVAIIVAIFVEWLLTKRPMRGIG
jgi:hypothetical protein